MFTRFFRLLKGLFSRSKPHPQDEISNSKSGTMDKLDEQGISFLDEMQKFRRQLGTRDEMIARTKDRRE